VDVRPLDNPSRRPNVRALIALTETNSWAKDVLRFQKERMLKEIPKGPYVPDAAERGDMIGRLHEEAREAQKALVNGHLAPTLDALGDLIYTAIGIAWLHGVDISPFMEEIHMANMEKAPADGKGFGRMTADGKSTKANWEPPRIEELLRA